MAEKAQFTGVNEHIEAIFNAAEATQIVFQQPARLAAPDRNVKRDVTQWARPPGALALYCVDDSRHGSGHSFGPSLAQVQHPTIFLIGNTPPSVRIVVAPNF